MNFSSARISDLILPLNVKAILEEKSPKYQQIMSLMGEKRSSTGTAKTKDIEDNGLKIGFIESSNGKRNLGRIKLG